MRSQAVGTAIDPADGRKHRLLFNPGATAGGAKGVIVAHAAIHVALEARIRARLETAPGQQGDISARAVVIASIARGLMLRARAGAGRATLQAAADEALRLLAPAQG